MSTYDVAVVGGGPAGLSAALLLGRARRRVLLLDSGEHRNDPARMMHGFLTRDGIPPAEFRRIAREQLAAYPEVELRDARVEAVEPGFTLHLAEGATPVAARAVLLATGMADQLPEIPGLPELYGLDAWHCPYCDGWERRDQPMAVLGEGVAGYRMALEMRGWSSDLVLCCQGRRPEARHRARLAQLGIGLREARVVELLSEGGRLSALRLADGEVLPRSVLVLAAAQRQRSDLAQRLGCGLTRGGLIRAAHDGATEVPGLYVAGDAAPHLQMAVVAAAQGAMAAFAINASLLRDVVLPAASGGRP